MGKIGTILIINKIGTLRRLTAKILKNLGYNNLAEASSVEDAGQLLNSSPKISLILMELAPAWTYANELEFVNDLRKKFAVSTLPIIITSEVEDPKVSLQFSKLGVKDFILQSFVLEYFSQNLESAISKYLPLEGKVAEKA